MMLKYTYQDLFDCISSDFENRESGTYIFVNESFNVRMFIDKKTDSVYKISFYPKTITAGIPIFILELSGDTDNVTMSYNTSVIPEEGAHMAYYRFIVDMSLPVGASIDSMLYTSEMEHMLLYYMHHHP